MGSTTSSSSGQVSSRSRGQEGAPELAPRVCDAGLSHLHPPGPPDAGSVLKVVVTQKTSSGVTEEVILEELQVFKVTFTALLAREGAVGWAQLGDTRGNGGSGLSLHCWSLDGLRVVRTEGGWNCFPSLQNVADAPPSPGGSE